MSDLNFPGLVRPRLSGSASPNIEYVIVQRPLHRVLAFIGRSIDDVVNNPIVKNQVLGYYKLHRWVEREGEISEMERAWNPLGRRT
jgi:hypothetical protein